MKRQVKINYSKLRDAELGYLASTVLQAISENATVFMEPSPSLGELKLAVTDYNGKMDISNRKGSSYDVHAKNASREVLVELLRRLAFYVNTASGGVLHHLLSSGFRLKDLPPVLPVPSIPTRIRLVDGDLSRQLVLLFDPVDKASEYECQLGTKVEGTIVWDDIRSIRNGRMKRENTISQLSPAMTYYARVRSRNPYAIGDWSE